MPSFLVETHLGRGLAGERAARERRAHSVADELTRTGAHVSFNGSIHIPEDEICFFVFDAASAREAAVVASRPDSIRCVSSRHSRHERNTNELEPPWSRAPTSWLW